MMKFRTGFLYLIGFILVLACAYKPPEDPNARPGRGLNLFPVWYDNMLGEQYGEMYRGELPLLENATVRRGVELLGADLVRAYYGSEEPPFGFEFDVVNLDIMNAFALPGGKIFVFRGLLEEMENEAELAGVLSHEMGHVVARHGTKDLSKAILYQSALFAGTALLSKKHEKLAAFTYIAGSIGISLHLLKFSRDHEREADWIAVHNVYRAGYDPKGMLTLFQHFEEAEKEGSRRGLMFLSSHPSPQERQLNMSRELPKLPARFWNIDRHEFQQMKRELEKLPPAPEEWKKKDVDSLTTVDSMAQVVGEARIDELEEEYRTQGTQTIRVYVPSSDEWIETAIRPDAGQLLELTAEGRIRCGPAGETCSPADSRGLVLAGIRKADNTVEKIPVGKEARFHAPGAGDLLLGIQDDDKTDNSGWYVVTVRVVH